MDNGYWNQLPLEDLLFATVRYSVSRRRCLDEHTPIPPKAKPSDDLYTYVLSSWCPWYVRTYGAIVDTHLNTLIARVLQRGMSTNGTLELLNAVLLLLTQPNTTSLPTVTDQTGVEGVLLTTCRRPEYTDR